MSGLRSWETGFGRRLTEVVGKWSRSQMIRHFEFTAAAATVTEKAGQSFTMQLSLAIFIG